MDATSVYALLQQACRALESTDDHAIAAVTSHAMAMIQEKYGVGRDHLDAPETEND